MADAARAEERKAVGNEMFAKNKLAAAIEAYSEAICFAPHEPTYYTNRAMCHRKREEWPMVMADCCVAIELDDTSIKGHYLLGLAFDAQADFSDAVRHLHRALELCKERTISYKLDIQKAMLLARKREWQVTAGSSSEQIGRAEQLTATLLRGHYAAERHRMPSQELDQEEHSVNACCDAAFGALRRERLPGTVPEYFICCLTHEIMLDPVLTPDGISYDKAPLLESLQKVGQFDPTTRNPLEAHQLRSNLGLKEAINAFLEANPWAYEG